MPVVVTKTARKRVMNIFLFNILGVLEAWNVGYKKGGKAVFCQGFG
jgi:hypothetical protein